MTWPTVSLGDICEFKYGKSLPAPRRVPGDVLVFGSNGAVGWHDEKLTDGPTIVIGRKGSFGEINYSATGCWPIDTTYFVDGRSTEANLRWLSHLLPTLGLTELNRAAAVPGLNREDAYRQTLLLPPLDEQRRIAAILDQADALRAKRRQALAHLDDLTQSIFLDMFGGGTFGDVALADLALGFRYGTSTKSGDAGLPTLRIPNVVGGALDLTDLRLVAVPDAEARRLALQSGDLLFVRTNGNPHNVGRCAVFEPRVAELAGFDASRFIYASYLIRLRPNRDSVEPSFLREFLLGSAGRRQLRDRSKTSAGQYNINIEGIGSVRVPEVAIADQREFSSRVAETHSHRIDFQVSADSLDQLFASIQASAFSGQL